jgi:hypothetical protein
LIWGRFYFPRHPFSLSPPSKLHPYSDAPQAKSHPGVSPKYSDKSVTFTVRSDQASAQGFNSGNYENKRFALKGREAMNLAPIVAHK